MWKVSGLAGLWQGRGGARTGAAGPWSSGGSAVVAWRVRRPGLRRLLGLRGLLHRALLRPSRRWAAQDGGAAGRSAAGAAPSPSGSLANCKELTLGDKACCAEATGVTARQASKPPVNRREQSARESSGSETNALCNVGLLPRTPAAAGNAHQCPEGNGACVFEMCEACLSKIKGCIECTANCVLIMHLLQ